MRAFGDGALVTEVASSEEAQRLAASLADRAGAGVDDVVVGYRSVTVVADPDVADMEGVAAALAWGVTAGGDGGGHRPAGAGGRPPADVPVAFDGPDLAEVAALAGMTPRQVVAALTAGPLPVALLGFLPGFAYLDGLPPGLAALPRRATPRPRVAAGSVGVAGGFAGVYPQASPGGWHVVGRSAVTLFDPAAPPYAALRPGDRVRLRAVAEVGDPPGAPPRGPLVAGSPRPVEVRAAGVLSLVQDLGRRGVAGLGVPRAGAADPVGLRAANRLVGNHDGAAAIEVSAAGPTLRFGCHAH
ncbi:MAG TPA: carboxyltransferase domain-containing protein, partial [Acidimicrobiales bacterium]|nr:carboxyltransferase domain-containing protein [Acidimicrobiales bacterium]